MVMLAQSNHPLTRAGQQLALRTLALQLGVGFVFVIIFGLLMAGPGTLSAFAGVVIALVPNIVFSALAFRYGGGRFAPSVVRYFFIAEAVKWLLVVSLLITAFLLLSGPWLPLFVTLLVLLHVQWLAPILLNSKTS